MKWHPFCDWSKWEDVKTGELTSGDIVVAKIIVQHRRCAICGKLEARRVTE